LELVFLGSTFRLVYFGWAGVFIVAAAVSITVAARAATAIICLLIFI
jgi:hypothetical protein